MTSKPVEVKIRQTIKTAAAARADQQRTELAAVAKQIVWQAAANAHPVENPRPYPNTIERGVKRDRLRMIVDEPQWIAARDKIRDSGQSVARVIEDGLVTYAETGVIAAPIRNPERTRRA